MSGIETFNRELFLYLNGGDGTPVWLVRAATAVANDLIYLVPLLLLAFWLWGDDTRRSLALKTCVVTLLGLALAQVIGALWPHPRPFMIGLGRTWIPHAADSSFPSDHMTVFGSIGLVLLFGGSMAWGIVTLLVGLCVAWARVFLGVHFPLDMAGAIGVAALALAVVTPVWSRVGAGITRLAEGVYRGVMARPIALGWVRR